MIRGEISLKWGFSEKHSWDFPIFENQRYNGPLTINVWRFESEELQDYAARTLCIRKQIGSGGATDLNKHMPVNPVIHETDMILEGLDEPEDTDFVHLPILELFRLISTTRFVYDGIFDKPLCRNLLFFLFF